MSNDTELSIWYRRLALDDKRRAKQTELMDEWLKTEFYPARKQLIRDCFAIGHRRGNYDSNGLGWSWFYCNQCGGRMEIQGPDDEKHADDGDPAAAPAQGQQGE